MDSSILVEKSSWKVKQAIILVVVAPPNRLNLINLE